MIDHRFFCHNAFVVDVWSCIDPTSIQMHIDFYSSFLVNSFECTRNGQKMRLVQVICWCSANTNIDICWCRSCHKKVIDVLMLWVSGASFYSPAIHFFSSFLYHLVSFYFSYSTIYMPLVFHFFSLNSCQFCSLAIPSKNRSPSNFFLTVDHKLNNTIQVYT